MRFRAWLAYWLHRIANGIEPVKTSVTLPRNEEDEFKQWAAGIKWFDHTRPVQDFGKIAWMERARLAERRGK